MNICTQNGGGSPVTKKRYVFDIDGTICTIVKKIEFENATPGKGYDLAQPKMDIINKINKLYDEGHTIVFQTARGFETGIDWREVTEKQLSRWGVKYHELHFGKSSGSIYVDDKGCNVDDFMPHIECFARNIHDDYIIKCCFCLFYKFI